ncbi:PRD domain-containing protein [Enterococcus eurekensis]|uniref:PRD domain-containing protein n=1 Tax=Enterococcus eurekensis TaxID=1159753 RepID=A0ABV9M356_9ENTE
MFQKGGSHIYSIVKSLNNNLVLAQDEQRKEYVLFGTGIGFKKKKGDLIEESLITKIFHGEDYQNISALVDSISPDVLSVTENIVDEGEKYLGKKLNTSLLISLADHIQSAINRQNEGIEIVGSSLQWEIPFLYTKESKIGKKALEVIAIKLGVDLPEMEAAFIALHFVNAQDGIQSMDETMLITAITKSMVKTIQSLFDVVLNKESMNYSRFVTHIRYFMNRQIRQEEMIANPDDKLYLIIQEQYPKSYACGLMIREMLKKEYQLVINDDEMIYLIIHIQRVVSETK